MKILSTIATLAACSFILAGCGKEKPSSADSAPEPSKQAPVIDIAAQQDALGKVSALTTQLGEAIASIENSDSLVAATTEIGTLNSELVSLSTTLTDLKPLDPKLVEELTTELSSGDESIRTNTRSALSGSQLNLNPNQVRNFHRALEEFANGRASLGFPLADQS